MPNLNSNDAPHADTVRRIRRGDTSAFARFVDEHGARVHRLARRYARTESDAEDLTQEIFVDLFRGLPSFRGESAVGTWVYRVALNHCLRHAGRSKPDDLAFDDALHAPIDLQADPERQAQTRELSEQVRGALDELSPLHRDVVILHELHGLTYNECARVLDVPVGTVKSRLSNAFRRLRVSLGGYVLGVGETTLCAGATPAAALPGKQTT